MRCDKKCIIVYTYMSLYDKTLIIKSESLFSSCKRYSYLRLDLILKIVVYYK